MALQDYLLRARNLNCTFNHCHIRNDPRPSHLPHGLHDAGRSLIPKELCKDTILVRYDPQGKECQVLFLKHIIFDILIIDQELLCESLAGVHGFPELGSRNDLDANPEQFVLPGCS